MKQVLVVVDMQKDLVDGALGTREAEEILPRVARKIRDFDGEIFVTYDTQAENYLETAEGKKLPVKHCIQGTTGWDLHSEVASALSRRIYTPVIKHTFGSAELPVLLADVVGGEDFSVELIIDITGR